MTKRNVRDYLTGAFDCETDPFHAGRVPVPFCASFSNGADITWFAWGPDCIAEIMRQIANLDEPYLIYVHAGGRFDFHFLWDHVEDPVTIIGGKLIEFRQGNHVWRDSYAIMPVPLATIADKMPLAMWKFEADQREIFREEIEDRCASDAYILARAINDFRERFEPSMGVRYLPLTIGQLALREFTDHHSWERATPASDEHLRQWYFGGRNECFQAGVIKGPWQVFDVNSHYGHAMATALHPYDDDWIEMGIPRGLSGAWMVRVIAENDGALPWRAPDNHDRLDFSVPKGEFHVMGHELIPAMKAGHVRVLEWREMWKPARVKRFDFFVHDQMKMKIEAEHAGDKLGRQLHKLIIASVSGKLGQNPRNYKDWQLLRSPHNSHLINAGCEAEAILRQEPGNWLELWSCPTTPQRHSFNNVGIAASITSASRAIMMEGLRHAIDPVYCDTDSIICRDFSGRVDPVALGAWKLEATGSHIAIAGRKTYCLYNVSGGRVVPVKFASKGESLTPAEIIAMARGGEVERTNAAPRFSLRGGPVFQSRTYKRTT